MKLLRKYTTGHIGEWFLFTITDLFPLAPENKPYFRIEDEDLNYFLVPAEPYRKYELKVGFDWWFRLDYIDCSGLYIFEPRHPVLAEKSNCSGKVNGYKRIKNFLGLPEIIIEVELPGNSSSDVRLAAEVLPGRLELPVWIERIKLGNPLIIPFHDNKPLFEVYKNLPFQVIEKRVLNQFGLSLVLTDEWNNLHAIPCEPYVGYQINIGDRIIAEIRRISNKGFLYLEPNHPVYERGKIYCFEILDIIRDRKGNTGFAIDILGNMIKINKLPADCYKNMVIQAKIKQIEKGIPQVDFADFC